MKTKVTTKTTEAQPVACCFYRISTDKQDTERQYNDVRNHCKAYSIKIVYEKEEVMSGAAKLEDRKDLQEFLKYVDDNKPQYVVVSELSRLARSQDAVDIIKKWTAQGICFISHKEGIRTLNDKGETTPTTTLLLQIMSAINEFELTTIQYRVKSGLHKTVNKGTWSGGNAPYGYDIQDQKLVFNSEATTVKKMFEWYSQGWGTHKIASYLNINKIFTKNGKNWVDTKVYKILSNSIYIGKRMWNGEPIEQPELKIVDDAVFASVQDRLVKNANVAPINKHHKYDYLLAGKITCACGKGWVGQGRHNIYLCKSKKYSGGCNTKPLKITWLDEQVKQKLMVNSGKLLFDNSGIVNKTKEMQDEVLLLQEKVDAEKKNQNYLINQISRIGQQTFEKKFDASTTFVKQLQEQIDNLHIKLNNAKIYMQTPPAIAIIKPEFEDEIMNSGKKVYTSNIFQKVIIDKELVQKVIDTIHVNNEQITVSLINGNTFNINRKKT